MSSVPEREEVDAAYKWDLEAIFETDEGWEAAYESAEDRIEDLAAYEGRTTESGETLAAVLDLREAVMREVHMVVAYAQMRQHEDTRDQEYQAMSGRSQSLAADASSAASFIEPELQSISREELRDLVAEADGLEEYDHYFDDVMRKKAHTRSAEVEELLADLSEVTGAASDIYSMLTNADMEFPTVEDPDGEDVELSLSNFTTLQRDPDREFRRRVYEAFYDRWAEVRNAVSTSLKKSITADVKLAAARDYGTAREAALDGPNVPVEVYDTLVETVRDNLDTLHRHADLKAEALGVDELAMWDLYMPMTDSESPEVTYEEATDHVVAALGQLGDEYRARVEEGLESRWVDVYENRGKLSGAYSSGTYDTQPYILMNYQDDVESMFTLAHELGHSLHSEYTKETQPHIYSGYEIFIAEVASTVNEALLTHHLLETVEDPRFRRHVLNEYLERFRSTLFRQTMFADFELQAHRVVEDGGALTADRFDEVYGDLKAEFYANADVDDRVAREWMRIPHFYRAYYVYQYSTGISAAVALSRDIREAGEPAIERYLEFLSKGSREYPLELLDGAGVDMATSAPIEAAIEEYDGLLDELEALL